MGMGSLPLVKDDGEHGWDGTVRRRECGWDGAVGGLVECDVHGGDCVVSRGCARHSWRNWIRDRGCLGERLMVGDDGLRRREVLLA